nr:cytochrome P450 4c3-like [Anoplophora glabripennis]
MENLSYYLLIFGSFLCVWFLWRRRKLYVLSFQLPGPTALPLVGNGFSFMCKTEELLDQILKLTDPYPSPGKLWLGPRLIVFIKDPDQLQVLMQSSKMSTKSFIYRFLEPFMGKGLFTSSGFQHKSQRKLLQPLFGPKVLEGYSHLFQKHATKFANVLKPYADKDAFDVLMLLHESAFEATMDILVEDKNDHSIDYKHIPEYVRRFYHIFSLRTVSFWMYPDCFYKLTSYYKEQLAMVKIATTLTEEVKNARIPEILKKLDCKQEVKNPRQPSMLEAMVEMVVNNPECLNETEFKDHMLTFVATSQDTQSSAIAFTLMMLGMHPQIQCNLVEELKKVLGDKKCLDFGDLGKLKYMEMCIKEAMRLFPLGPFLPRDVVEDVRLGKWTFPAGCSVLFCVYQVHRNPRLWEKPEEFYPEHFTAEAISNRHPFAFLPFSAGPRRCIAQQYSYVNMKIIIGTILQNYIIECGGNLKDLKLLTDVSIRPSGGYMIRIKNRKIM